MADRDFTVGDGATAADAAPAPSASDREETKPSDVSSDEASSSDQNLKSLEDIHSTVPVQGPNLWRRLFAFAGPAYLVSVGYMDPGNWATDIKGGASFGYELLWILLMSNLMALLLQTLSARLGIVAGRAPAPGPPAKFSRPPPP